MLEYGSIVSTQVCVFCIHGEWLYAAKYGPHPYQLRPDSGSMTFLQPNITYYPIRHTYWMPCVSDNQSGGVDREDIQCLGQISSLATLPQNCRQSEPAQDSQMTCYTTLFLNLQGKRTWR